MKENIVVLHINQRYLELIAFRGICETLKKEIDMWQTIFLLSRRQLNFVMPLLYVSYDLPVMGYSEFQIKVSQGSTVVPFNGATLVTSTLLVTERGKNPTEIYW